MSLVEWPGDASEVAVGGLVFNAGAVVSFGDGKRERLRNAGGGNVDVRVLRERIYGYLAMGGVLWRLEAGFFGIWGHRERASSLVIYQSYVCVNIRVDISLVWRGAPGEKKDFLRISLGICGVKA